MNLSLAKDSLTQNIEINKIIAAFYLIINKP